VKYILIFEIYSVCRWCRFSIEWRYCNERLRERERKAGTGERFMKAKDCGGGQFAHHTGCHNFLASVFQPTEFTLQLQ
jgi:hypothetical protein